MPGSTPMALREPRLQAGDGGLDLRRERRGAGAAAEARRDLGAPQPALLGRGLRLVEVAGGQLHGLDADAIELLRVILERERHELEHAGGLRVRQAHGHLALPARGLELGITGSQRRRQPGGVGERGRRTAREPLRARGQRAAPRRRGARAATPSLVSA